MINQCNNVRQIGNDALPFRSRNEDILSWEAEFAQVGNKSSCKLVNTLSNLSLTSNYGRH